MNMTKRAIRNWKKRRSARYYKKGCEPEVISTAPLKGTRGGNCNITACQSPGAIYMNVGHGNAFYCRPCAYDINKYNQGSDGFTLFPAFEEMEARRLELIREGEDVTDVENYADIEQDPWGSCYHFDRDKYEKRMEEAHSLDRNTGAGHGNPSEHGEVS